MTPILNLSSISTNVRAMSSAEHTSGICSTNSSTNASLLQMQVISVRGQPVVWMAFKMICCWRAKRNTSVSHYLKPRFELSSSLHHIEGGPELSLPVQGQRGRGPGRLRCTSRASSRSWTDKRFTNITARENGSLPRIGASGAVWGGFLLSSKTVFGARQCLTTTLGLGPALRDRVLGRLREASSSARVLGFGFVNNRKAGLWVKVKRGQELAANSERMSLVGRGGMEENLSYQICSKPINSLAKHLAFFADRHPRHRSFLCVYERSTEQ